LSKQKIITKKQEAAVFGPPPRPANTVARPLSQRIY